MIPTELIDPIVQHIRKETRAAAIEALDSVLGTTADAPVARRNGHGSRGDASPDRVLAHVRKNPGQRSEEIGKALGASPKAALTELREAKKIKTKGQRRGMTYSVR